MAFELLSARLLLEQPDRLTEIDSWHEHIPFAFLAVELQRPDVLVELGTWRGDSYCAFCQAVAALELPTRCTAVDTWGGDLHTGAYPAEHFEELRAYHDARYGAFSELLRSTFDDALARFPDGGIDLLHIDGCHTYDAVRHDFEAWRPKLSERALVLFHDTSVREGGFGVWRLWEELAAQHPSFEFTHGHGLGVLAPGAFPDPAVLDFLALARGREDRIRSLFRALGSGVRLRGRETRERPPVPAEAPLVSILLPVHDPPPGLLQRALDSVTAQTDARWELCICDDASRGGEVASVLARASAADARIRVVRAGRNLGISGASNRALALARGEFVALLDHDDELAPDALAACLEVVARRPDVDVVYSDEDKIDLDGEPSEPFAKPAWSPHFFRGVMYVGHLLFARRALVEAVGGFDGRFDGVQDYELMLRLGERTDRVEHLPRTLYHWRKAPGSVAADLNAKADVPQRQVEAVNAHLRRCGVRAVARPHARVPHRVELHPEPRSDWPAVTIVVAGAEGLDRCLESIHARSTYPRYDVVAEAGVEAATGEVVVLLDSATEVVTPDWLEALVWPLEQADVGAVGPLLVGPDGNVASAGLELGRDGAAVDALRGLPADGDGFAGSLSCLREAPAIRTTCAALLRTTVLALGGVREDYRGPAGGADLCLRLRARGRRVLWTPRAVLVDHGDAPADEPLDRALLLDVWGDALAAAP